MLLMNGVTVHLIKKNREKIKDYPVLTKRRAFFAI